MVNEWFYLALLVPALVAVLVLADDIFNKHVYENPFVGTIITGFFALLPVLSLFFIPLTIPSTSIIIFGLLAGFLMVVTYWLYFKSLTITLPSIVMTVWNTSPAFIPFLGYFFLKEQLNLYQFLGFTFILVSSLVISIINIEKFKLSQAFYLMILASFFTAISVTAQKYIYASIDFWSGFIFVSLGMGVGSLFFSIAFEDGRKFVKGFNKKYRKYIWLFVVFEALNIAAVLTSNLAISKGPASLVKVIEGIQPIYMLLFSTIMFPLFPKHFREGKDANKIKKILIMIFMIIGLYLIYKS